VDRYLEAPTIECTKQPVQGRSGGALFNTSGEVVGVCSAADPQLHRGIYVGLRAIHALLDRQDLAILYDESRPAAAAIASRVQLGQPVIPASLPEPSELGLDVGPGLLPPNASSADLVAVVRGPDNRSEVLILDRASPELLKLIQAEANAQDSPPSRGGVATRDKSSDSVQVIPAAATTPVEKSNEAKPSAGPARSPWRPAPKNRLDSYPSTRSFMHK
jgi:hypothetical protein